MMRAKMSADLTSPWVAPTLLTEKSDGCLATRTVKQVN